MSTNSMHGRSPKLDTIRRIYSVWGRHPRLYAAQDWLTFIGKHEEIRRAAAEAMGVGRGARVLEVGCGTGRNFPYIEALIGPQGRLVGFDYTARMLDASRELCAQEGWSNVELVEGDAAKLDVGHEPFDAVLSVLAMSAIPDHRSALERCRDVLRPGGVLSVCDAQLFPGALRRLNPVVRALYTRFAAWDPDRDICEDMRRVFDNVAVETFNHGSFFIARSSRNDG